MTREENACEALVALCGFLACSPVYGTSEKMWSRDLREVLGAAGQVPKPLRALFDAAQIFAHADGPYQRRNAMARLRIEVGAYFEHRAVVRVAALREVTG